MLRNPLADPFMIGTSSGAVLGVALAYILPGLSFAVFGFGTTQIFAFVGAVVAVAIVYALSRVGRQTPALTFLLAGFAVSTLMIAAMWLLAYESGNSARVLIWTMGSLSDADWGQIDVIGPAVLILFAVSMLFVRDLNALLLGENQAAYLGVDSERSKMILICLASLLTALAVSLAGVIGFVGLVVPHVARLLYGANHRIVLIASLFLGGRSSPFQIWPRERCKGREASCPSASLQPSSVGPSFSTCCDEVGVPTRFDRAQKVDDQVHACPEPMAARVQHHPLSAMIAGHDRRTTERADGNRCGCGLWSAACAHGREPRCSTR